MVRSFLNGSYDFECSSKLKSLWNDPKFPLNFDKIRVRIPANRFVLSQVVSGDPSLDVDFMNCDKKIFDKVESKVKFVYENNVSFNKLHQMTFKKLESLKILFDCDSNMNYFELYNHTLWEKVSVGEIFIAKIAKFRIAFAKNSAEFKH